MEQPKPTVQAYVTRSVLHLTLSGGFRRRDNDDPTLPGLDDLHQLLSGIQLPSEDETYPLESLIPRYKGLVIDGRNVTKWSPLGTAKLYVFWQLCLSQKKQFSLISSQAMRDPGVVSCARRLFNHVPLGPHEDTDYASDFLKLEATEAPNEVVPTPPTVRPRDIYAILGVTTPTSPAQVAATR
jgi:hypothetical protein